MALELPVYDYSLATLGTDSSASWSFATLWPLRPASESTHLRSKFCALLEGLVAAGDWHGWMLLRATEERAEHFLDLQQRKCCCCSRTATHACAREPKLGYCRNHGPLRGAVSLESKGHWLIIWQTRARSSVQRQKAELRKLWHAARWCPETALDFEPMFDESVLSDAQLSLGMLNPLMCMRIGILHLSERAVAVDEPACGGREQDLLCLADLVVTGSHKNEGPVARFAHRYAHLLAALPGLRDAPLRDLERALCLHEELRSSLPDVLQLMVTPAEERRKVALRSKATCAHTYARLEGAAWCSCGAGALAACLLCGVRLCGECARQPLVWQRQVLLFWEGRSKKRSSASASLATDACSLSRLCACCAEPLVLGDSFCTSCMAKAKAAAHNLQVLETLVRKHATPAEASQPTQLVASSAEQFEQRRPLPGLETRGILFPPSLPWLLVECRHLTPSATNKAWLVKLVQACLELHGRNVLDQRLQRIEVMEAAQSRTTGCPPLRGARAEFARLILDVLCLLRIQGAWSHDPTGAFIGEVISACLERLLPQFFDAASADARKQLLAACRDLALSGNRESWWRHTCTEEGCGERPRASALLKAWRDAAVGAPSRLPFAFACGHAFRHCKLRDDLRCLNCLVNGNEEETLITPAPLTSKHIDGQERSLTLSRCPKCRFPISFGRTVFGLADLVRSSLSRERAALVRASFLPNTGNLLANKKGDE